MWGLGFLVKPLPDCSSNYLNDWHCIGKWHWAPALLVLFLEQCKLVLQWLGRLSKALLCRLLRY
jgi:hypothetical protein